MQNETIKVHGREYNVVKRVPGEPGKSNTVVYMTRPKGRIAHIASEHMRKDGSIFYSPVAVLIGHNIK